MATSAARHCRAQLAVGTVLTILLAFGWAPGAEAALMYPDRDPIPERVAAYCRGLHNVIIGHPEDAQRFLACCGDGAASFVCRGDPVPGFYDFQYSPAFEVGVATFNHTSGKCVDLPTPPVSPAAPAARLPAAGVCAHVVASRSHFRRDREERDRRWREWLGHQGGQRAGRSLLQGVDPLPRAPSPQAPPPSEIGAFELINNPQLNRSSTGVMAIHATLLARSESVILVQRQLSTSAKWNFSYEPGIQNPSGNDQNSAIYHTNNGTYEARPTSNRPFCMGQAVLSDGSMIGFSGSDPLYTDPNPNVYDGRQIIRRYSLDGGWVISRNKLNASHWYPTVLVLPDERVLVIRGTISRTLGGQPLLELYDAPTDAVVWATLTHPLTGGYTYYPHVYLLPWTPSPSVYLLAAFDCRASVLFTFSTRTATNNNPAKNTIAKYGNAPQWPATGPLRPFCTPFSAAGTSALLTLFPSDGYVPRVVVFGGFRSQGVNPACVCNDEASPFSMRVRLDQASVTGNATPAYVPERMPGPRVGVDEVVLPNGRVLLVNGARFGRMAGDSNGGSTAKGPVYEAWQYDPLVPLPAGYDYNTTVSPRYKVLAASSIIRYYHSTALLLPDASVLVAGSEQGANCYGTGCEGVSAPPVPEYRAEKFKPPYFFGAAAALRPEIHTTTLVPSPLLYGASWVVHFSGNATGAVLVAPGAVTHQINMAERVISVVTTAEGPGQLSITAPPNVRVAPPGYYMFFLLNVDLPSTKSLWVKLAAA